MGMLIDGRWQPDEGTLLFEQGSFVRPPASIRGWVTREGAGGAHDAERGRYRLYLAEGCPWAHRAWLVHTLKGLAGVVALSFVAPAPSAERGWVFDERSPRHRDPLGRTALYEVYADGARGYTGRATVPVLYDEVSSTIVSNESADIVRMLGGVFAALAERSTVELYPAPLRSEIDALNERIYRGLNDAVYRAGFARTSAVHEAAKDEVFATLDWLEGHLAGKRYLCGDALTEADVRLLPTLVRFDAAYCVAFRCDRRRIADYSKLSRYQERLLDLPGVAATVMPAESYRRGYCSIPFAVGYAGGGGSARV